MRRGFSGPCTTPHPLTTSLSLKNVFIRSFSCLLSVDFLSGIENIKTDAMCLHGVYLSGARGSCVNYFRVDFYSVFNAEKKASQNGLKSIFSAVKATTECAIKSKYEDDFKRELAEKCGESFECGRGMPVNLRGFRIEVTLN